VKPKRITFVASEMLGLVRSGGLGTATTFLALALGRAGHEVSIVLFGAMVGGDPDPYWKGLYRQHGVTFERLAQGNRVNPSEAQVGYDLTRLLLRNTPDVVIAQDTAGPAAQALELRRLGLGFRSTRFVTFCHGNSVWLAEAVQKLRTGSMPLELELQERVTLALADAVVSPSAYLLEWLRNRSWKLADRQAVIPYVTRATALGQNAVEPPRDTRRVSRIAYFGRIDERKGIRIFLDALALIDPQLFSGVELCFFGEETKTWPAARVEASVSATVGSRFSSVQIETSLDQHEALERLSEPGTLAVMASLVDNSPNTVYECIELGIPFLTTDRGGTPEIIAPEDRPAAVVPATATGIANGLRRTLTEGASASRAAHAPDEALRQWLALLEEPGVERPPPARQLERVTAVVTVQPPEVLEDTLESLNGQTVSLDVVVADSAGTVAEARMAAIDAVRDDWVLLLRAGDRAAPNLVEELVRAQQASGADAVTCGVHLADDGEEVIRLYDGSPGGFGLLSNRFGTVTLVRRTLLAEGALTVDGADDPDWPFLAALAFRDAAIVSIPKSLIERRARPEDLRSSARDASAVLVLYEHALPPPMLMLGRLAATSFGRES